MQFCVPLLAGGPLLGGALPGGGESAQGGHQGIHGCGHSQKVGWKTPPPRARTPLKGWWGRGDSWVKKTPDPPWFCPPPPGVRVLLVDQWVETGGTMQGAIQLVERQGGVVAGKDGRRHPGWISSQCLARGLVIEASTCSGCLP